MQQSFPVVCSDGVVVQLQPTYAQLAATKETEHPLADDCSVLGVWQHVFAARPKERGENDCRVSHTRMAQILREVAAQAGVLLISAACQVRGIDFQRTYMQRPDQDVLRPLCFPQARRSGTHETIIPMAFVPLVLARMGKRFVASTSATAFQQWLPVYSSFVLSLPSIGHAAAMNERLLQYVSTFNANWGPIAPLEEYEYEVDDDEECAVPSLVEEESAQYRVHQLTAWVNTGVRVSYVIQGAQDTWPLECPKLDYNQPFFVIGTMKM